MRCWDHWQIDFWSPFNQILDDSSIFTVAFVRYLIVRRSSIVFLFNHLELTSFQMKLNHISFQMPWLMWNCINLHRNISCLAFLITYQNWLTHSPTAVSIYNFFCECFFFQLNYTIHPFLSGFFNLSLWKCTVCQM